MPTPPTITAEIRSWQLDDENHRVEGRIFNDLELAKDGSEFTVGIQYVLDYPLDLLVRSKSGQYYLLRKNQAKDKDKWTK